MILQLFDNMSQCTDAEVKRLLSLVSEQRREQALRYKHLFGQFACLKSYEMLKQCVMEVLSDVSEVSYYKHRLLQWNGSFVYNEHGKPLLQDAGTGEAITGVDFSISHCKEGIVVAFDNHPIGVDIESYRHFSDSLLQKTMSEEEISKIQNSTKPSIEFTRIWTQKEALLKMLGTGLVDELPDVLNTLKQYPLYQMHTVVNETKGYVYSIIV